MPIAARPSSTASTIRSADPDSSTQPRERTSRSAAVSNAEYFWAIRLRVVRSASRATRPILSRSTGPPFSVCSSSHHVGDLLLEAVAGSALPSAEATASDALAAGSVRTCLRTIRSNSVAVNSRDPTCSRCATSEVTSAGGSSDGGSRSYSSW